MADLEQEYEQLLADKKKNKLAIKQKQVEMSKEFKKSHKWHFRILDIMLIFCIVFNSGALLITHALVLKAQPNKTFVEANPVMGESRGFQVSPQAKEIMLSFIIQMGFWGVFVFWYVYTRYHVFTMSGLWQITFSIIFAFMILYFDFVNDFGYWIGKIIFGG